MLNLKKYKIKTRIGTIGDLQAEWMTPEDWKNHEKNVKKLKEKSKYLEEHEITIILEEDFLFDSDNEKSATESYKMEILKFE